MSEKAADVQRKRDFQEASRTISQDHFKILQKRLTPCKQIKTLHSTLGLYNYRKESKVTMKMPFGAHSVLC